MKLPLELSNCIVDLEEVAAIKYYVTNVGPVQGELVVRDRFDGAALPHKALLVILRSNHTIDLQGEDAAIFASVFGKQVKEWVNEQVLQWRKGYEENKDKELP